jgi:glycosyltransferase involved in cell wall biosynthesis
MEITKQRNSLTIIIPVFNEQDNIQLSSETLITILNRQSLVFKILYIDDGSQDKTWEQIQFVIKQHPTLIQGLKFTKNFGKESAIAAGLDHCKTDAALIIDGDLQHPPTLIPSMIKHWRNYEADVVEGIKSPKTSSQSLFHKMYFSLFKKMIGFDMSISSDFKLLDRSAIEDWKKLPERGLFFRGMSHWIGRKRIQLEFDVQPRLQGQTKWSFWGLLQLAIHSLLAYSSAPIRIIGLVGIFFVILSFIFGSIALYQKFMGIAVSGFTTVILLLLFLGGCILFSLCLIGYFIGNIYNEVKFRPRYLIEYEI